MIGMRFWFTMLLLGDIALAQDLRGPILSDQFDVHASDGGIFVTGLHYKPTPALAAWTSAWIWADTGPQTTRAGWMGTAADTGLYVVNFKKVIVVGEDVESAQLKLSA